MTKIFTKKEVAELLGVSTKTLQRWTEEKIQQELLFNCCLEVLRVQKVGRAIEYTCIYKEVTQDNKEFLKREFKVRKVENFINYSKEKIKSINKEDLRTRKEVCCDSKVPETTSKRYDKKLKDKGVLTEDGYIYVCVENKTRKKVLVTKDVYNNFWIKAGALKKELKDLNLRRSKKELSNTEYEYLYSKILEENDYMYYKLRSFIVQYDNELTKLIMNS